MSKRLLEQALQGCPIELSLSIANTLADNAVAIVRYSVGEESPQTLMSIAHELSQLSGGSGIDLIRLFVCPDPFGDDAGIQRAIADTRYRIAQYVPGTEYPIDQPVIY